MRTWYCHHCDYDIDAGYECCPNCGCGAVDLNDCTKCVYCAYHGDDPNVCFCGDCAHPDCNCGANNCAGGRETF